ncbi:MAG: YegS/Rv2252/BmrU family lipid kinase [Bacteroidales bacterium]|jgi:YegS/Rv2252/BmrU family lipid kinase|nr:YegS/Rv2252/BmrU family lipid kinase [Bacteroidales bacterium]
MKERILFIINPISGIGKQKRAEAAINRYLDKTLFDFEIIYTQYAHHATAICEHIVSEKSFQTVAIVGGDGSINDCVKGLVGSNVRLAIIPAGSGNGLARTLKIPLTLRGAIAIINERKAVCIDTVALNDKIYASIAGIGFDALVAKEFSATKIRGFIPYFQIVATHYPLYKPKKYSIKIDKVPHNLTALFICFANSTQFGYNTLVAPSASLTDGQINVICVKKIPIPFLPIVASFLFTKHFEQSTYVKSFQAKEILISNNGKIGINLDGEYFEEENDIRISIKPRSLHVLIP